MTEPLAEPFPDRGHEALRQELLRAIAEGADAGVDRADLRRILERLDNLVSQARAAIQVLRSDVNAHESRIAALELRLPPL